MFSRSILSALVLTSLVGCSNVYQSEQANTDMATDGEACVGTIMAVPDGLRPVQDAQLLAEASGEDGQGKLCEGRVFEAEKPITVYRVWNSDKDYTLYGRWWSLQKPEGPKAKYRKANGICPSWSALDVMSQCKLKVGAKIVIGPGQSAQCKDFTFEKSATNQVFINNDSRNNVLMVQDCTQGTAWPVQ
mgnify:CR=1 FL=1